MQIDITSKLDLSRSSALSSRMESLKKQNENLTSKFSIESDSLETKPESEREFELKRLKNVANDFESLLINDMLKSMRKTINKTELIDGGMAEDLFEDMLYSEYSKEFSKTKVFGISEMIYNQMEKYI
jgi:flagellar protein FlgJ